MIYLIFFIYFFDPDVLLDPLSKSVSLGSPLHLVKGEKKKKRKRKKKKNPQTLIT